MINPAWYVPARFTAPGGLDPAGVWHSPAPTDPVGVLVAPVSAEEAATSTPSGLSLDGIDIYTRTPPARECLAAGARVEVLEGPYAGWWEIEGTPASWHVGVRVSARRITNEQGSGVSPR